jgi:hypothetical protein
MGDGKRPMCQECQWYQQNAAGSGGQCRHASPTPPGWARVNAADWCGDYMGRPSVPAVGVKA